MAGWGLEWNLGLRIAFGEKPPGAAVVPGGFISRKKLSHIWIFSVIYDSSKMYIDSAALWAYNLPIK